MLDQKEVWLNTLKTSTPQEGFELAIKLSRMGVKSTQPNIEILKSLRPKYANDALGLTTASQVIALNFQTVSAANNYWK
ncbi:hexameric tyrosine-coordinated heme protein [Tenacibaculum sp. ZS6-P6]|uniref:hexameric tyrosine-coordinated heme protein n=1 Tax=Tenacibaculum sp. ZS6-P6 TaxID=3447503 RepID=UPI003F9DC884